ncbi:hypothetical protein GUJ93_ZPchr0007g4001 [Zizania palustris]|uniref:Uncharacterized protein n=1 Tax=Zizania palustris TaxID=103762 RepID=A0A8J5SRC1_ZIZPA|nr:hypothetical protein GUJ93_ZPchr0007g4001 [Zizania palustris]
MATISCPVPIIFRNQPENSASEHSETRLFHIGGRMWRLALPCSRMRPGRAVARAPDALVNWCGLGGFYELVDVLQVNSMTLKEERLSKEDFRQRCQHID